MAYWPEATSSANSRCVSSAAADSNGQTLDHDMFIIHNLWNGKPDQSGDQVNISLTEGDNEMKIEVAAPFYNDPAPPNGKPGEAYYGLWEYEVVEAMFLASKMQHYLELEFSPHGQHLVLLLKGARNAIKHSLALEYKADIEETVWKGMAKVPKAYFPDNFDVWNAYAIHGTGDDKVYKSLFPVPGDAPDFHRLHDFKPLQGFQNLKTPAPPGSPQAELHKKIWTVGSGASCKTIGVNVALYFYFLAFFHFTVRSF